MLLVLDAGNTNTVMGVYDGDVLKAWWRLSSGLHGTADEFSVVARSLFAEAGVPMGKIRNTIVACVVPPMRRILAEFCEKYLGHAPLWVDASMDLGMPILYANPLEVGADRIVNAVAAYEKHRCALVVIDFGTATTFDCISGKGEYLGGAISPGIGISAEALFARASKLPRVELFEPPARAVGKHTAESMQAGIIFGYAALVDGMTRRIAREMAPETPRVVATGGLASLMDEVCETIGSVDPDLTLEGLRILHKRLS
ncbi:MAG: type III pantothenate kinase [Deltaproteobacteria bacterium]|nr:type III pantothenate kinase [Deltaproteobacteria bacterium]